MSYTKRKMFSGVVIGLIVAVSGGTWVYTKMMERTGQNVKSSVITACIAGFFAFVIIWTIVLTIDSFLGN